MIVDWLEMLDIDGGVGSTTKVVSVANSDQAKGVSMD
jgi:hypothetical protein